MSKITVNFYETAEGRRPAEEFILEQNPKIRAKIYYEIGLLERLGTNLRMPHSEYLGDGIFQVRAQTDGDKARVLYFFMEGNEAILTNGFLKKTPRTPLNQLELAKKYRNEYLRRNHNEKLS